MSRSETLKAWADESARLGHHVGRIPLGYLPEKNGSGSTPDLTRLPHIMEAREKYKSGEFSVAGAQKFLLLRGVRSTKGRMLARSSVYAILINPYYDGYTRYKNRIFLRIN